MPDATETKEAPPTAAEGSSETNKTEDATGNENNPKEDNNEAVANNSNPHKKRPITAEGDRPQKKFYRQRAHCNPLSHNDSFPYPRTPDHFDWTEEHYPKLAKGVTPTVLDIGCGFGGLTLALAPLLPDAVILGMEIRAKVTEYVRLRIVAARQDADKNNKASPSSNHHTYQNCSVLRTNSMKFLPHFFRPASLDKLFFCFPDPHFKRKNHPRRIISERLLSEYAYLLRPRTGRLYCITDVEELHQWHVSKCDAHPLFRRLEVVEDDPCVAAMRTETEEGKKVEREGRDKYYAVYERIDDEEAAPVTAENFFS